MPSRNVKNVEEGQFGLMAMSQRVFRDNVTPQPNIIGNQDEMMDEDDKTLTEDNTGKEALDVYADIKIEKNTN